MDGPTQAIILPSGDTAVSRKGRVGGAANATSAKNGERSVATAVVRCIGTSEKGGRNRPCPI
jgi:hypothetical protein